jgi:hypothetical protein
MFVILQSANSYNLDPLSGILAHDYTKRIYNVKQILRVAITLHEKIFKYY